MPSKVLPELSDAQWSKTCRILISSIGLSCRVDVDDSEGRSHCQGGWGCRQIPKFKLWNCVIWDKSFSPSFPPFFSFQLFEAGSCCVAQADIQLEILLIRPLEHWDYHTQINFLTPLCLSFIMYKMGIIALLCRVVVKIKWADINKILRIALAQTTCTMLGYYCCSCCLEVSCFRTLLHKERRGRHGARKRWPVGCVSLCISESKPTNLSLRTILILLPVYSTRVSKKFQVRDLLSSKLK